jgi:hypothetical protein
MRKSETDMLLISKLYDFVLWSANHIAKFPRAHKFTLGDRLATQLYETLETLVQAKYTRDRAGGVENRRICEDSFPPTGSILTVASPFA